MFKTMFARLMVMFLSVILLMLGFLSTLSYINLRNTVIDNRMNALIKDAREIAFLSGSLRYNTSNLNNNKIYRYLQHKISYVQTEYDAYVISIDKNGEIMDNLYGLYVQNEDFVHNIDTNKVIESLKLILSGKEIKTQDLSTGNIAFSVGVPFIMDGIVQGAVFIHTDAQKFKAEYVNIALLISGIFLIAVSISGIIAAVFTKKITDPLESIEKAVKGFSKGTFNNRVKEYGTVETKRLAEAFNYMADKIESNEKQRKEFVANVSHELRSPVTSINGYVCGMLDKTIPEEKYPYYLDIVYQESLRLKNLIEDLLNLSRLESGTYKPIYSSFNINELIRRVLINKIGDIEEKNIDIDTIFDKEDIFVWADKDRIVQVLSNLLDNAIKFVDKNGSILFKLEENGQLLNISIEDNGSGIKDEDLNRIFERFYKQDKARTGVKGTGLGLSICKQIIDSHKQNIWVEQLPQGTKFTFTLEIFRGQDGDKGIK